MNLTGCVNRRELSPIEIEEYRETARRINPIFRDFSMRMYGEIEMRKLHKELCFNMTKTPEEIQKANMTLFVVPDNIKAAMQDFADLYQILLEGHIAMAADLSRTFHLSRKNEMYEYDDYLQEACLAMRDAAFCYNGSTVFSTYAYKPIQRRLIDLANQSRVPADIREEKQKVYELLNQGKNFEEAISDLNISDERATRLREYRTFMSRKTVSEPSALELDSISLSSFDKDPFETSELWEVYQTTILSKIERIAIQAYLNDETMSDVALDNDLTRQGMVHALNRALAKVRVQYDLQCAENITEAKERQAA